MKLIVVGSIGRAASDYMSRSSSLKDSWFWIAVFGCIGAIWLALIYWDNYRRRLLRNSNNPKSLFFELCQAHRLDRKQRSLLMKAVQYRGLKQPALLFVDPELLGGLVGSGGAHAKQFAELRQRLFGDC